MESLSTGLQNALWELGGVPAVHRTDRMTAAIPPGTDGANVFTDRYRALLEHYGLTGQAIQAGKANENGDCEQSHRQFKRALEQALLLHGSRDFASRAAYEAFLRRLATAAAIDRLVHHSVIVELNIPSYRAEQAKKAKQGRAVAVEESAG